MAAEGQMPRDPGVGFPPVPVFTPRLTDPHVTIAAAGSISVEGYQAVLFTSAVAVAWDNTAAHAVTIPGGQPFGICYGRTHIYVGAAADMIVM